MVTSFRLFSPINSTANLLGLTQLLMTLKSWTRPKIRETMNTGSGTRSLGTQGPKDWRTGDPGPKDLESCVALQQLYSGAINSTAICYKPRLMAMSCMLLSESVIHSRPLFSNSFDSQGSLVSVLQSQICTHKGFICIVQFESTWPLTPGPHTKKLQ